MKKILKKWQNFYRNNKVLATLSIIVILCLILIVIACFQYFFMGIATTKYGDRLNSIKNVKITSTKQKSIAKEIEENEKVSSSEVKVTGKIIYITIKTVDGTSIEEAESIAVMTLEKFSEKQKSNYDFQYFLVNENNENGYNLMGAKNINSNSIIWTNNTTVS